MVVKEKVEKKAKSKKKTDTGGEKKKVDGYAIMKFWNEELKQDDRQCWMDVAVENRLNEKTGDSANQTGSQLFGAVNAARLEGGLGMIKRPV